MKYFGRNNRNSFGQISVSNSSTRLQLSSVSRPPELAPHCANQWKLEFFLYLGNALIFTQNIQLVTMYEQYGSIKRNAFVLKLLTNITFTHCCKRSVS